MKTKIVLWGKNTQEERVLIALELLIDDNKVRAYTFPGELATEEFSQLLMKEWRDGSAVEFPDGFQVEDRDLTITGQLLPEGITVEREDVVQRAQAEWHFMVLSAKLHRTYVSELHELKDRIERLKKFDGNIWDELKGYWDRVQEQVREKNLFREHADQLRENTNALFGQLKELRHKLDEEFDSLSKDNFERLSEKLSEVEQKITEGLRLQPLFEDLKEMQRKFRDIKLNKEHRAKIWDRMDAAFKAVKEKRFGPGANDDRSPGERLQRRFDGLMSAIDKMERSIKRDEDELHFQQRKVDTSDGQLEAQIRQAKIKMIEERIRSKRDKWNEMDSTRQDLERRLSQQKEKDAKRQEQQKVEEAKKAAQHKIAEEIKSAAAAREKDATAQEPTTEDTPSEPRVDSILEAAGTTLGEALEDVVDTVRAVAEVVGHQLEDAIADLKEQLREDEKPVVNDPEPEAPASEPESNETDPDTPEEELTDNPT
ncbi:MAG: hypothetical protein H6555_00715 [Lewinellaceae bacterium]|nr:hypothetical protein [Lewinellaceae bacterium]